MRKAAIPDFSIFGRRYRRCKACGLLTFIPHVFESDKPEAEMLHAYPIKDGGCEPWERSVALAAHAAGLVCIAGGNQKWAIQFGCHLLPIPSHMSNLAVNTCLTWL